MLNRSIGIGLTLAFTLLAGCAPKGQPASGPTPSAGPTLPPPQTATGSTPAPESPESPAAAPGKPAVETPTPAKPTKLLSFPVDRASDISVSLPKRSPAVVGYYDRALAARGWKKREAKSDEEPGHREWLEMPVPAGPTDLYDAAWVDPKTGRVAVLNLFHTKEAPDIQQGNFEIHARGHEPWKQ